MTTSTFPVRQEERCNVLVGVDYSTCSDSAAALAVRLPNLSEGTVVFLHVFEKRIMRDFGSGADAADQIQQAAHQFLQSHLSCILKGDKGMPKIVVGDPLQEILVAIAENQPELFVIGSREHRSTETRPRSGFAFQCASQAVSDVLVVRPAQPSDFQSIVVGVNFSQASMVAARRAASIASVSGASLQFVYIDEPGVFENEDPSQDKLEEWIRAGLSPDGQPLSFTCNVMKGPHVGEALIDCLNESHAELVVLGTTRGYSVSATLDHLVKASPASLLIVKSDQ